MPVGFTSSEREHIKEAVRLAETKTCGEIVPMVVDQSGHYGWVRGLATLSGLLIGALVMEIYAWRTPFPISSRLFVAAELLGGVLAFAASFFPACARVIAGHGRLAHHVHERALVTFLTEGLTETRNRTGVLIYVSVFERQVEIIGDRGIHDKVKDDYWKKTSENLSAAIRSGRLAEGFVAAIQAVGSELALHFPRHPDDVNELPDDLRN